MLMTISLILLVLVGLYLLALRGRSGHPGMEELLEWKYAHRGLHDIEQGVPENSLEAFRLAAEHGYGAELDVHLLKDGNLGVMHDSLLKRTTGQEGRMEDLTEGELGAYHLQNTDCTIPTLRQVLDTVDGRTPLIIELKTVESNGDALCRRVMEELKDYPGLYCLESFDPRCIIWLKKHHPELIRGQLAEDSLRLTEPKVPFFLRFVMTFHLANFLSRPDFIAYQFETRSNLSNFLCRKLWGIQGVSWTLRSQTDYDTAVEEGWLPIFEGFRP